MPLKNKKSARFNVAVPVIIIIYILDLLFLYYLKYRNQDLSLSEFRLDVTGNMLNLVITLIMCAGVIIYTLQKKKEALCNLACCFYDNSEYNTYTCRSKYNSQNLIK